MSRLGATKKTAGTKDMGDLRLDALRSIYEERESQPGSKKSRLYETCLTMIERSFWNPGDRLPTDLVLTENLPVSLGTVQSVFRRLRDENLIIRNKRQGSFVASAEKINRDYRFFAFLDDDGKTVIPVATDDLSIEAVENPGQCCDFLGRWPHYVRITRTVDVRGEFRLHSQFYLALPRFDLILDLPVAELTHASIKNVLQVRFGAPTLRTDWYMRFVTVADEQAKRLRIETGATVTQFTINGTTLRDEPLFVHRIVVPRNDRVMKIVA